MRRCLVVSPGPNPPSPPAHRSLTSAPATASPKHTTDTMKPLVQFCAQGMLLLVVHLCCTSAMRLAIPQQGAMRVASAPRFAQPLPAARQRRASICMADEPPAGKLGKGDLVDAISLKAGVNKKTAALVLGAGMRTSRATSTRARAHSGNLARAMSCPALRLRALLSGCAPLSRQLSTSSSRPSPTATRSRW